MPRGRPQNSWLTQVVVVVVVVVAVVVAVAVVIVKAAAILSDRSFHSLMAPFLLQFYSGCLQ